MKKDSILVKMTIELGEKQSLDLAKVVLKI